MNGGFCRFGMTDRRDYGSNDNPLPYFSALEVRVIEIDSVHALILLSTGCKPGSK
jgi:hypothetical protein